MFQQNVINNIRLFTMTEHVLLLVYGFTLLIGSVLYEPTQDVNNNLIT